MSVDPRSASHVLARIAAYLELHGENKFKARAYETAAKALRGFPSDDLAGALESGELAAVRGLGPATLAVVRDLVEHGQSRYLEQLRQTTPEGLLDMLDVPGLTPAKIHAIHEALGIETLDELEEAARDGRLAKMPRYGKKTSDRILQGIAMRRARGHQRLYYQARGEGERLRMGIMQVKTIPETLGVSIAEERAQNGPYRSFQDFLRRVKPESSHARALVRAGCCDSIAGELTRPALMWRLYVGSDVASSPLPIPDDYSTAQKRAHEIESFGFLASRHPLTLYRKQIERLQPVSASQMRHYVGQRIIMVGVLITEKAAETKHSHAMEFITLEDVTALYDATLFPEVYRRCCHRLSPNRPYVVQGLVEESFGIVTLTVLDLQLLELTMSGNRDQLALPECVSD